MSLCYQAALTDWRHSSVFQGHLQPENKGKHLLAYRKAGDIKSRLVDSTSRFPIQLSTLYTLLCMITVSRQELCKGDVTLCKTRDRDVYCHYRNICNHLIMNTISCMILLCQEYDSLL